MTRKTRPSYEWHYVFVYQWTGTEFARVAYCRREHAIEVSKRRWPDKPWAMEDFHFGGGRWINGSLQVNKKPPLGGGKHLSRFGLLSQNSSVAIFRAV